MIILGYIPGLQSCGIYLITPIGAHPPQSIPYACWLPNSFPNVFLPKSYDMKAGSIFMYEPPVNRIPKGPTAKGREYLQSKPWLMYTISCSDHAIKVVIRPGSD